MVIYTCFRCGFTNKIKCRFIKHLNRKFTCKPILQDIPIEEIYKKYFKNSLKSLKYVTTENQPKINQISTGYNQNQPKNNRNTKYTKNIFYCKYCNKRFSYYQSLNRHENHRCKKRNQYKGFNDLKKLVNLLNNQLEKKDKQIDSLMKKVGININTQNNIQNNIKILAYNKTDLSHLQDKDYLNFLNHNNFCVPYMIKKIHFDTQKPENHNIYISNIKNNYIMVYDGKKWNIRDRNEVINDMIEDKTSILEEKIEDWLEHGKEYPEIMKKFNRYLEKKENDTILNKIKKEIKFVLFNNRTLLDIEQ